MKDNHKNKIIIILSVVVGLLLIWSIINISKNNTTGNDILLNQCSTLQNSYDEQSQQLHTCQYQLSSINSTSDSFEASGNALQQRFEDYVTCRGAWENNKKNSMANELASLVTSCTSLPVSPLQNGFCNNLNNYYQAYFNSNSDNYYGDLTCTPDFHYP